MAIAISCLSKCAIKLHISLYLVTVTSCMSECKDLNFAARLYSAWQCPLCCCPFFLESLHLLCLLIRSSYLGLYLSVHQHASITPQMSFAHFINSRHQLQHNIIFDMDVSLNKQFLMPDADVLKEEG